MNYTSKSSNVSKYVLKVSMKAAPTPWKEAQKQTTIAVGNGVHSRQNKNTWTMRDGTLTDKLHTWLII